MCAVARGKKWKNDCVTKPNLLLKPHGTQFSIDSLRFPELSLCFLYCLEKEAIPVEKLVNIQIPPTLKKQLVDDCEFITHLGQVVIF
ncbi:hypothetical protein CK203_024832 [Vitis vinifera]|uniref:Uncharacterized protein n=1 Tax=Vitis vinifera TaxID=29760 RepID=A0A438IUF4_VITVI|nr:hypothetical protein CK203_024832 [Vitis vinifera]